MSKILITGSAGFVFSNVVLYLLQHTKHDVVGIDKLTYAGSIYNAPEVRRYKLHIGDVCDYHFVKKIFEVEKPDVVIHGAACSHVDNAIISADEFVRTNVVGTHSILEAALKIHTPKKIINFSTDECYGQILDGSFTESSVLCPRNPYAASKASGDLLGQSYYSTHKLPVITTRCCNIFGSRQHKEKLIPKCITNILTGQKIPVYGDGKQVRQWIYIKDVFNALIKIIDKGKVGEIYNISSDVEKRNIDLINFICDNMDDRRDLIEYVTDRKGHDFRYSIDSSKLKQLGWKTKYDFEEALLHTIGWFMKNRWSWNR